MSARAPVAVEASWNDMLDLAPSLGPVPPRAAVDAAGLTPATHSDARTVGRPGRAEPPQDYGVFAPRDSASPGPGLGGPQRPSDSTGNPAAAHASNPPIRSPTLANPRSTSVAAAMLDE